MKTILRYIAALGDDIEYIIGKNSRDNFTIIDNSSDNDIWFHINNEPSGHVIASMPDDITFSKKQLRQIITQGAIVCKEHSRYKSQRNLEVVYAPVKNVEKTDILGKVMITNSKIISV
jgi:predicted ribosome quality control (RQC) complex YloA/Tae2 family protein